MQKTKSKTLIVIFLTTVSLIYLFNPGWGVFELIPDNIPVIGNLDEFTAAWILLSALAYFGFDLRMFLRKRPPISSRP